MADTASRACAQHEPYNAEAFFSGFDEEPKFDVVQEIQLRGSASWSTLTAIADCFESIGAEPLSLSARRYDERAQIVTCRVRLRDNAALAAATAKLAAAPGVTGVAVSHHLTRRSR